MALAQFASPLEDTGAYRLQVFRLTKWLAIRKTFGDQKAYMSLALFGLHVAPPKELRAVGPLVPQRACSQGLLWFLVPKGLVPSQRAVPRRHGNNAFDLIAFLFFYNNFIIIIYFFNSAQGTTYIKNIIIIK